MKSYIKKTLWIAGCIFLFACSVQPVEELQKKDRAVLSLAQEYILKNRIEIEKAINILSNIIIEEFGISLIRISIFHALFFLFLRPILCYLRHSLGRCHYL